MAKTKPRVIALMGMDSLHYTEDGAAAEAITPGMLVEGTTSVLKHSVAGGAARRMFALERDEMGKTIDDAYAIADTVKVGNFRPGDRVNALIGSGENIAAGAELESAGDGTLRVQASGVIVGFALEAVNNSAGPGTARLRTEVY